MSRANIIFVLLSIGNVIAAIIAITTEVFRAHLDGLAMAYTVWVEKLEPADVTNKVIDLECKAFANRLTAAAFAGCAALFLTLVLVLLNVLFTVRKAKFVPSGALLVTGILAGIAGFIGWVMVLNVFLTKFEGEGCYVASPSGMANAKLQPAFFGFVSLFISCPAIGAFSWRFNRVKKGEAAFTEVKETLSPNSK